LISSNIVAAGLTTAHLSDACLRVKVAIRCAPVRPIVPGARLAGRVLPVRHYGSVDIFLEVIDKAVAGDVLVVDNGGRRDEACVGDLVTLEAAAAGLSGIVIWGCHRDTAEIRALGFPLFSRGAIAAGPERLDTRESTATQSARVADFEVYRSDVVVADDDGALFLPSEHLATIVDQARQIRDTERRQAIRIQEGTSLREQLQLAKYLEHRAIDPSYTFRLHLRSLGGSIEE
jgi:4-hydroxy-4-methyl-2-oxoglutarate aldolase